MLQLLSEVRHKCAIGFVGGSNLVKQQEQLGGPVDVTSLFDFCFAENGLTAIRMGEVLASQSFIAWIGEDKYKELTKWYVNTAGCRALLISMPGSFTTSPISTFPLSAVPSSSSATA